MTATDRWNNRFPVGWEGKISGDDRLFRTVLVDFSAVDGKTVIAQVLSEGRWLVVGEGSKNDSESGVDEGVADLVMEQAVADIGKSLIRAVSKRKFRVYCHEGSNEFLSLCKEFGVEHETFVELTPEQVLSISEKIAVMVLPAIDGIQGLRLDTPSRYFSGGTSHPWKSR